MTLSDGKRQMTSFLDSLATVATHGTAFNRASIEAMQRSSRLWAAGLQDIGQRCVGAAQNRTERFQATAKALSSAKSVRETLAIQAAHLGTEVEQSVKQATDLQEAALQVVQRASAPLIDHLTASSTAAAARHFQG
ncbi:phasin family protein [Muricoccus nepalensis]|nr:phasin family protein [Roseomonas nepalensis]